MCTEIKYYSVCFKKYNRLLELPELKLNCIGFELFCIVLTTSPHVVCNLVSLTIKLAAIGKQNYTELTDKVF